MLAVQPGESEREWVGSRDEGAVRSRSLDLRPRLPPRCSVQECYSSPDKPSLGPDRPLLRSTAPCRRLLPSPRPRPRRLRPHRNLLADQPTRPRHRQQGLTSRPRSRPTSSSRSKAPSLRRSSAARSASRNRRARANRVARSGGQTCSTVRSGCRSGGTCASPVHSGLLRSRSLSPTD